MRREGGDSPRYQDAAAGCGGGMRRRDATAGCGGGGLNSREKKFSKKIKNFFLSQK
jgi:hypothetical protein